jgi:hypothetical protein
MRAEIEIKEIKLNSGNIYLSGHYSGDGLYIVEDELKGVSFVVVLGSSVWYLDNKIPNFIKELKEQPKPEEKFSEEFILKLVAIAANKENYKNVNAQPIK